ncbi:Neutral and basic amino acid transport protein rBAT [Trichinella patagoniensis]|uniref:Neutral and basic amino acid transport protein rBAT n=1 Tax=Trichinella patagoniensis TaxID=990121 RepID=A0A0V0ZJ29_9BILA|nr:Neutral and basic amino acid transport protein rBAT [Trichinella patagoniensis]KRY12335.1 Neutral and basic amino acid transport protein rBAT [Trichinella patagoniensis]
MNSDVKSSHAPEEPLMSKSSEILPDPSTMVKLNTAESVDEPRIVLNIGQPKKRIIGLTKEQLQIYADDPYWKKLRISLFVLFWIIWIALFATAVVIVALTPKCPGKPVKSWWQNQLCYRIWTYGFKGKDGRVFGTFQRIEQRLGELSLLGVDTIWPTPALNVSSADDDVNSFITVDPKAGTMDDFKNLIKAVHRKGMRIVINYPLTTSEKHEWYKAYKTNQQEYLHFYMQNQNGGNYYVTEGYGSLLLLNFDNPAVRMKWLEGIDFWLNNGIDGFYIPDLTAVKGLFDVELLLNELQDRVKETVKKNQLSNDDILIFASLNQSDAAVMSNEKLQLQVFPTFENINSTCNAMDMANIIETEMARKSQFNSSDYVWQLGSFDNYYRLVVRMDDPRRAELVMFSALTLPGSVIFLYGDEIGLGKQDVHVKQVMPDGETTENDTLFRTPFQEDGNLLYKRQTEAKFSSLKTIRTLSKLRNQQEAFIFGNFTHTVIDDLLIIWRSGVNEPTNYVAVFNFGNSSQDVHLQETLKLPSSNQVSVAASTSNVQLVGKFLPREKLAVDDQTTITVDPLVGVLLKYK